jgi:hypothetical protein
MFRLARLSVFWVVLLEVAALYGQVTADSDALGVPALGAATGARGGETSCPADYLAGQDPGACGSTQWYFYSDLQFCVSPPTTCRRVRCENFPDSTHTITAPIGVIRWTGIYVDDASNGCTKPAHLFRVRFYLDDNGAPANPSVGFYTEEHEATVIDTTRTVTFATVPATVWQFTFVLDNPVPLTTGWFSICGDGTPGCYHLWEGSNQGDNKLYQWSETGGGPIPGPAVTDKCDLAYCFSEKHVGACCLDCGGECVDNVSDVYCAAIGGRWVQYTLCADLTPPCGDAPGACCHADGTCTITACCDCEPTLPGCAPEVCLGDLNCDGRINAADIWCLSEFPPPECNPDACLPNWDCNGNGAYDFGDIDCLMLVLADGCNWGPCAPPPRCIGDMNCDGYVDFGDINPFVLYLSDIDGWVEAFPNCNTTNGDINSDGTCVSFTDINPFVSLLTSNPLPIICSQPPGTYWAGPNTSCEGTDCCIVVVPPGAPHLENEPSDCAPDTFNGGCIITPPLFSPIQNGWTVYGQSGTFESGGSSYRDTDWYQVMVTEPTNFTVTVEAEFDVMVLAYRAGPNPSQPCDDDRDVAAPAMPPAGGHNKCTPVVLATRCLPAGTYWFVVTPASFSGVPCGADYKITLETNGPCAPISCADCPPGAYLEGTNIGQPGYCNDDPSAPDPNGGCNASPYVFEPLPEFVYVPGECAWVTTICGKLWAHDGYRDQDWWSVPMPLPAQLHWTVLSEVPCRATLLFSQTAGGGYGPPSCTGSTYMWFDTLYEPCVAGTWNSDVYYDAAPPNQPYLFVVSPEDAAGAIWSGYPCPMGGVDLGNDYQITFTIPALCCENEILAKPVGHTENEPVDCNNPLAYDDMYNSGCDGSFSVGPTLPLSFDTGNAWGSRTFAVLDPNNPGELKKDYDWYQFTLAANRRFKVYLYAPGPMTWEIWPADNCVAGAIEGVDVPQCYDAGVYTRQCYTSGTYWLRVYPAGATTWSCGAYYYLALTEAGSCVVCTFSPSGLNYDDPCDDVNQYDTNAGCDNPSGLPPHYMPFVCGGTYWGKIYAGLQNGAPSHDPDWFTLTQTNTTNRRLKLIVTAEFLAQIEVYLSCADYDSGNVVTGLFGVTPLAVGTACPNIILTATTGAPQGTVFYGRITCVDQFGNLMTKYYPCAKGNNRWKIVTACII